MQAKVTFYIQPLGAIERRVQAKMFFSTAWNHKAQDAGKSYILFSTAGNHRTQDAGKSALLFFNRLET